MSSNQATAAFVVDPLAYPYDSAKHFAANQVIATARERALQLQIRELEIDNIVLGKRLLEADTKLLRLETARVEGAIQATFFGACLSAVAQAQRQQNPVAAAAAADSEAKPAKRATRSSTRPDKD